MDHDTIRTEEVQTRGLVGRKGWLVLTTSRLAFKRNSDSPAEFTLRLNQIERARAKKAFRWGYEVLEVTYRDDEGKRHTKAFERTSRDQWANRSSGHADRNSFASFERDIADARALS